MNKNEALKLALKAGLIVDANQSGFDSVEAFAELIRADEREACAKVCEDGWTLAEKEAGQMYAEAIRARGNT